MSMSIDDDNQLARNDNRITKVAICHHPVNCTMYYVMYYEWWEFEIKKYGLQIIRESKYRRTRRRVKTKWSIVALADRIRWNLEIDRREIRGDCSNDISEYIFYSIDMIENILWWSFIWSRKEKSEDSVSARKELHFLRQNYIWIVQNKSVAIFYDLRVRTSLRTELRRNHVWHVPNKNVAIFCDLQITLYGDISLLFTSKNKSLSGILQALLFSKGINFRLMRHNVIWIEHWFSIAGMNRWRGETFVNAGTNCGFLVFWNDFSCLHYFLNVWFMHFFMFI